MAPPDKLTSSQVISSNTIEESKEVPQKAGKRCVQKVVMEEKVEYDDVVECEHSYDKRCYTSLSTVFKPYQVKRQCRMTNNWMYFRKRSALRAM